MAEANPVEDWRGAGVVLQIKNIFGVNGPMLLVGKETYFTSDIVPEIIPFQTVAPEEASTIEEAEAIFSERAKQFEEDPSELGLAACPPLSFDTPRQTAEGWTTNFRQVQADPTFGFPKGRRRRSLDANPKENALRELEEETGVHLLPEQLSFFHIDRGYHFFLCTISSKAEYDLACSSIAAKNTEGNSELQDISFTHISEIRKKIAKFNGLSRKVLNDHFFPKGV